MLKIILEEVVGMFSEALKIMDDNMYHYMADQYQAKVERQQAEIENQQVKIENLQTESFSLYFIFLTFPIYQLSGTACPHAAA
ncbi:MAG: hypothetical protein SO015_01125 [Wujia sp.]|nr:hypothetical protein [Wujia sp.]MDY3726734.1 hypothetical protein [Wujia sp.]